jgi:surface antigen
MALRNAAIATTLMLACGTAHAANLGFLGNAPISRMTAEDVDLLYAAAVDALEHSANGVRTGWENPSTSAAGTFMPTQNFSGPAGEHCRQLQVTSRAGGLRNQLSLPLCKQPDGTWKIKTE